MNKHVIAAVIGATAAVVGVSFYTMREAANVPVAAATPAPQGAEDRRPYRLELQIPPGGLIEVPVASSEPFWGRPTDSGFDPERWPPKRSDWSDEPVLWELRVVDAVAVIPSDIQRQLRQLNCVIPRYRGVNEDSGVVSGEFERRGQQDLVILCVHADKTSATYVFWGSDPARREVMPQSGSSINPVPQASLERFIDERLLDRAQPVEDGMPTAVDHDAIEIGCCECCSTIFYRFRGEWLTLPGSD